jgi:nicotinamide riboside transporter PnuC
MNVLNLIAWLLCGVSLIGTVLNAKRSRISWVLWFVGSLGLFLINMLVYKFNAQAVLWLVYCVLDIYGWNSWKENK